MKLPLLILLLVVSVLPLSAEGIRFFEGTWDEAVAEAKRLDRIIFVDAYAVWCGPCKKMAAEVFPDDKVGEFYNKNFINLKLDAEKGEGLKFREKYPISAFPTLFYIDYTGDVVQQVKGAQQIDGFIELGKKALTKIDRSQQYVAAYESGDRDPELVLNYVRALNKAGKSSIKISNDYLRSQKDLSTPFNLRFILEAASEADSRIFDMLIERRAAIEALEPKQAVKERIREACEATAQKALEFRNRNLLEEAIAKMKKYYPEKAASFRTSMEMDYWSAMGDVDKYIAACQQYAKTEAAKDEKALMGLGGALAQQFGHEPKAMQAAENFSKMAADKSTDYKTQLNYAGILMRNGKKDKALEAAKKALEMAKPHGDQAVRMVEFQIQQLKSK
ncbi:MAG: thioredoxin family protein [Saprospiraceae bacterium]|jgi:thiol-disulfide isomerase/thioredoxin|nr:thioredoxin family protein [Saprospiraceae bacterium]HRD82558.1 thioredoxin domain-containing protein [Saprospiraceae bacterium]